MHHLCGLRGQITLADHPSLVVGGHLSRDIDRARARSDDDVRVSRIVVKAAWPEMFELAHVCASLTCMVGRKRIRVRRDIPSVVASAAKQSMVPQAERWIASLRNDGCRNDAQTSIDDGDGLDLDQPLRGRERRYADQRARRRLHAFKEHRARLADDGTELRLVADDESGDLDDIGIARTRRPSAPSPNCASPGSSARPDHPRRPPVPHRRWTPVQRYRSCARPKRRRRASKPDCDEGRLA